MYIHVTVNGENDMQPIVDCARRREGEFCVCGLEGRPEWGFGQAVWHLVGWRMQVYGCRREDITCKCVG